MLLNKSQPGPPRISQHQQGAGDLQIKHSHYLWPPNHAPLTAAPVPLIFIAATTRKGRDEESIRYDIVHQSFFVFFWTELREGFLPAFLSFSADIMWSASKPELPPCQILPFINKSREERDTLITGVYYGSCIITLRSRVYQSGFYEKKKKRLHIAQKLHSRYALQESISNYNQTNYIFGYFWDKTLSKSHLNLWVSYLSFSFSCHSVVHQKQQSYLLLQCFSSYGHDGFFTSLPGRWMVN